MKAKNDELWLRSLTLSQEFDRYLFEHPRFAERIPFGAHVILLPAYDHELWKYNLQNARLNHEPERPIVYIEIDRLRPRRSQITRPRLKVEKKSSVGNVLFPRTRTVSTKQQIHRSLKAPMQATQR